MKIVFWGTPKYAAENLINIVNAGHEVIAVVTQPDRKARSWKKINTISSKTSSNRFGYTCITTQSISKDENIKNILSSLKADIIYSCSFWSDSSKRNFRSTPKWVVGIVTLPYYLFGEGPLQFSGAL